MSWDDPENPVIGMARLGFVLINVREQDREFGELLNMTPEAMAVARQPIGHGIAAFDLVDEGGPS